jgi:hypothetical protein
MKKSIFFIFFLTVLSNTALLQSRSNLEIFYLLADSSASGIMNNIPENVKKIGLNLNLGNSYSILGNRIVSSLQRNNYIVFMPGLIKEDSAGKGSQVNYVIDNAGVRYGEMFRRGFLGDYYIPRNIFLSGNFLVNSDETQYRSFIHNFTDTIRVDEINKVENGSFPFTQGDVPAEPFFSGLLEPVIAVGTVAVAVFLFFTIRSR